MFGHDKFPYHVRINGYARIANTAILASSVALASLKGSE